MSKVPFICSEDLWESGHGPAHPLKPERLRRTYELLKVYGAFENEAASLVEPQQASVEELCLFHTEEYVDVVQRLSRGESIFDAARYNFGPGDNPVWANMFEVEALKVGGALLAADLVTEQGVSIAFNFAGGMHHAGPARASGFCVFNDAAVAINHLLRKGLRVAYVDIDAHHGDGVQYAFYDTDRVLTISLHESGQYLFPGTGFVSEMGEGAGRGYAVNLPLPPYTGDEVYLWAFRQVVPPLVEAFRPDVLVSQLGVDTHYLDPLTHLSLTTEAYIQVVKGIKELAPRWLALGGGGYNVEGVARAWCLAYGVMLDVEFPDQLPEPYRNKYGGSSLRDSRKPVLDEQLKGFVQNGVERSVEEVKSKIFPVVIG
ncbi:MAG: acetoin utilization protein AcuC [Anaerolineae bacterium]